MDHCDVTSSQFVLCIELSKKIVKKKTRFKLCNSVTRPSHRDIARLQSSPAHSTVSVSRFAGMRRTRMNTGDSHRCIFQRRGHELFDSFFVEDAARFRPISALKIFFRRQRNFVVMMTIPGVAASCSATSATAHSRNCCGCPTQQK